jgi:scyllo-inositol 2-dehydrogenase (NADP+)
MTVPPGRPASATSPAVADRGVGRVALVGYGFGGAVFHAPFIAAEPRLELAAVVTADAGRQATVAARYPGTAVLDRFEDLQARLDDIDLVVISTPNATHVALATAVLAAGRPAVVDKPVAPTPAEIRALATRAHEAGVVVVPFHNRRWDGDFRTVAALVAAGELGRLHGFESRYERWQPQVPTDPGRAWKRSAAPGAAAGILFDLGTHIIDQAVVLFGRPESVYAEVATVRSGAEVDDDIFVALHYPADASGRPSPRVHLWASAVAAEPGPRFRLLADAEAYVKWGMDVQEAALLAGQAPTEAGWGDEPTSGWGHLVSGDADPRPIRTLPGAYTHFYAGMAACLLDGAAPPVDIADAVTVAEIIDAAYRSGSSRAVVAL